MRLLLINPTIVDKREHVHLGLGTVGTYVKHHSGHDARILDFMSCPHKWHQRLAEVLADYRPDLIGMYIATPYFPAARAVAAEIKRLGSTAPVLAGGHHPTLSPDEVIAVRDFDMLIIGEGEKPVLQLLDTMAAGEPLAQVPGLWWREGDVVRKTPKATLLEAENMPGVDWSLHDEETLRANFYFWGVLPVMASRGCPARCSFCSITNVQRLYSGERFLRFRDPVVVVDEIEADFERYRDHGMRMIFFYDLNFLVNPRWLRQFTDEYKRRGLNRKLKWSAYTRADHVVPATIEALKDSGCVNLRVGIEAANPHMRNVLYEKNVSQEVLEEALRQIKRIGISITGYFMVGGPGERPEWLMQSLDLVKRHGVEFPVFFLFKPLAGTDVLARAEDLGSHVLTENTGASADFLHGVQMSHKHIKAWQLTAFMLLTHVLFGPKIVWRQLRRTGWHYLPQLAQYIRRGMASGFSFYGALTYFIFYGYDHLQETHILRPSPRPGWLWRMTMAFTRLWLGDSGEPDPGPLDVAAAPPVAHTPGRPSRDELMPESALDHEGASALG
jgi:Radical SAM superfamily/B12 binding domain